MSLPVCAPLADAFPLFGSVLRRRDNENLPDSDIVDLLRERGAILLKEFAKNADAFVHLTRRLVGPSSSYEGGALDRASIPGYDMLFTTTGADQRFGVPLHGEMYYSDRPPRLLCFYCQAAPVRGGQTTLCDGLMAAERLEGRVSDFFRNNLLKYIRRDDAGCSEYLCPAFIAGANGIVFINNILPVFTDELTRNEKGVDVSGQSPSLILRTETGARLPLDLVLEIRSELEKMTIDVEWESGDILLVDNRRAMHGRRRLIEGKREIYVQLIA